MAGMILAVALEVMDRDFAWGEADCGAAACEVFRRLHGVDPMAEFRGRYASAREAVRIARDAGGWEALAETVFRRAGLAKGRGEPGEIGLVRGAGHGPSLAICVAPGAWAGKTLTGLATLPQAERCWRAP